MDSRQTMKEERAEAAAWLAADELRDVSKERRQREEEYKFEQEPEQRSTGYLGSILKSVEDTYDHNKEAVTSKTHDNTEKTQGSTNLAAEEEWRPLGVSDTAAERGIEGGKESGEDK
ncbi:embryonic cell protein 63 [Forsythia ovata]|uniref:Embryonic cell protein 63 n=1 Tax=Forsythia ovata TaxID=205694 RepID=A0ABD1U478_9LAMI